MEVYLAVKTKDAAVALGRAVQHGSCAVGCSVVKAVKAVPEVVTTVGNGAQDLCCSVGKAVRSDVRSMRRSVSKGAQRCADVSSTAVADAACRTAFGYKWQDLVKVTEEGFDCDKERLEWELHTVHRDFKQQQATAALLAADSAVGNSESAAAVAVDQQQLNEALSAAAESFAQQLTNVVYKGLLQAHQGHPLRLLVITQLVRPAVLKRFRQWSHHCLSCYSDPW
jgi:hypothetical protein